MKKITILLLCAALILCLCACGDSAPAQTSPPEESSDVIIVPPEEPAEEPAPVETEPAAEPAPSVPVTLFFGDDNAEYIISEEAAVAELSPQALLDLLRDKGVLSGSVNANSFTVDNYNVIQLDLSADFSTMLSSMGSAGEYIMLGSLVNTFITAYEADGIFITVDGQTLESGHAVYDETLGFFSQD